jgi:hypothetical protein
LVKAFYLGIIVCVWEFLTLPKITKNNKIPITGVPFPMIYEGVLSKMKTETGNPLQYYLISETSFINVNQLLDKTIQLEFLGFQCLHCHKKKKIWRQGFCYDCFSSSASAGDWIIRPELSKAHLGIADRDLDYEIAAQVQPHVVYLAAAGEVKVGVTRKTQLPTRWIDQGADKAMSILEVPNRYLAGITEVALKSRFTDKTNWRKMLCGAACEDDLYEAKQKLIDSLPDEVRDYFDSSQGELLELKYPVLQYPTKVQAYNPDKAPSYRGRLIGIKGQYLIFEDGTVFNIRTYEGYVIRISL